MSHSLYEAMRHFADSWGLVFMALTFAGLIGWGVRPGIGGHHRRAAHSIFEEDERHGG